jgi:hypothetical protein
MSGMRWRMKREQEAMPKRMWREEREGEEGRRGLKRWREDSVVNSGLEVRRRGECKLLQRRKRERTERVRRRKGRRERWVPAAIERGEEKGRGGKGMWGWRLGVDGGDFQVESVFLDFDFGVRCRGR